jgi:hypothetical protein
VAEAKRQSERVSGVPNTTYDLIAILHSELEGIAALQEYKQDAQGDQEVLSLLNQIEQDETQHVNRLRELLAQRLQQSG